MCDFTRFIITGVPETEVVRELMLQANNLVGADAYYFKACAEAMEIIPNTNNRHAQVWI